MLDKKAAGGKAGTGNAEGNKVVLCRIGDKEGQGDEVQCVLMSAEESTLTLGGLVFGNFVQLCLGVGLYVPEIYVFGDWGRGSREEIEKVEL